MKILHLVVWIAVVTWSGVIWALPCPEGFLPDQDQDQDGIPNQKDPCCFVASPGDHAGNVCNFSDPGRDLNFNGITAENEGRCCILPESNSCKNYGGDEACLNANGIPVDCDLLLWYLHMPLSHDGENDETEVVCSGDDCICYTVGDSDDDGNPSIQELGDSVDTNQPFDRCPTEKGENKEDEDTDLWALECDSCPKSYQQHKTCEIGGTDCAPPGQCVQYIFPKEDGGMRVENFCSHIGDQDLDGFGDDCDNCPKQANKDQADKDSDDIGDACDRCPNGQPTSATDPDDDDDNITNSCDNCPDTPNSSQSDRDSDHFGDACDNCPDTKSTDMEDVDSDGVGDACDMCPHVDNDAPVTGPDADSDEIADECDNCIRKPNKKQDDVDSDGVGDACDMCPHVDNDAPVTGPDADSDEIADKCDNCVETRNEKQEDGDKDGVGDACDMCPHVIDEEPVVGDDDDSDGIANVCDLCPHRADENPVEGPDADSDGIADECDNCINQENRSQEDEDSDGVGNVCTPVDDYLGGGCTCLVNSHNANGSNTLISVLLQAI